MAMMGMVGAGISAAGAEQQASAQAAADQRQSQEYILNSQLEQRQSAAEEITGQYQQRSMVDKAANLAGKQTTGFAAGGLALTGSPMDVIAQSAREAHLDIEAVKYNTDLKSDNLLFQAQTDNINSDSALQAAQTAQQTGDINAASALFGGLKGLSSGIGGDTTGGAAGGAAGGLSSLGGLF